jgi:UDP-N-acetyl-D-glucosamine/UDP-N-acetyl-D-galactosamine dehydrogenase
MVAAVPHRHYLEMSLAELTRSLKPGGVLADVKCAHDAAAVRSAGFDLWRL